jgi:hypothetical protein
MTPLLPGLLCALAGCSKEVKAEFPRPPATASTKAPAPETAPEQPAPLPEEPPAVSESPPESEDVPEPPPPPPPVRRPKPATEVPPVEPEPPEPPSTQIAGADGVDSKLVSKLDTADRILGSIGTRDLTPEQSEQFIAAKAFVSQAHQALEEGDPRRALVLIDKGLILAQDVERLSRP